MIIDAHFHADFLDEVKLKEIEENKKIKLAITNSVNMVSCKKNIEISKKYPKVKLALGLYPEKELKKEDFDKLKKIIEENNPIALGEIGLDLHHYKENLELQKEIFIKELDLAKEKNLPVIIHTRKAEKEVLDILESYPELKKILHCFSGKFKLVERASEMGCYFSIPTNIARSEHFQKMVRELPKEKILTETDSPYLSPFRDKKNEPAFISESIKKISEIWEISEEEVEEIIERNFKEVFNQ
jgi:TatD DNase family protein